MANKQKTKVKINYMHYICVGITFIFLLFAIFVFPNAFIRLMESIRDLFNSMLYYFKELFYLDVDVSPTINEFSSIGWTPFFNLPATWEEFVIKWHEYWNLWTTSANFGAYMSFLSVLLSNISRILLVVAMPLILILYIMFDRYLSKFNNDYNKDSKPLTFFKWFGEKVYIPVKNWFKSYFTFLKEHKVYTRIWLLIWLYNFNFISIIISFFAYYFYFVVAFDFVSLYKQAYKLFCDLSVMIAFIPPIFWFLFAYLFICFIRKKIGYARLNHFERKNRGFIDERPIVSMVCGTMGKKKTTTIVDVALSQEVMLRDKAFEKIVENDLKFPYFAWVNLENALKYAIDKHYIYSLATIEKYIKHLEFCFYASKDYENDKAVVKSIKRHLKKTYNINYDNFLFDYDYEKYGYTYDDKLKVVDIWEVIEIYSKLYFVYIIESSLMVGNLSIRTDNVLESMGNFPNWNDDFFKKDSRIIDFISRHAHILDFDGLRLGRKIVEDNPKRDSLEFGVYIITEIGKERKNNLELKETKKKEDVANQKNDGFNDNLKMIRHKATIDNYPFIKFITDEQRPESWGADARDLTEIVHIRNSGEKRLAMPFFSITDFICNFIIKKYTDLYYRYRYVRSDNTLPMYIFKKLTGMVYQYQSGIYNTFGYCKLDLDVESGTQDGELSERNYYLMNKKVYSKRFSTDCFSDFFRTNALKSKLGLNDLEEYATEKATFEELKKQNSYFIHDLMNKQGTDDETTE